MAEIIKTDQKTIRIGDKFHVYTGDAIQANCYETDLLWGGRGNFKCSNEVLATQGLNNIQDGLYWMRKWSKNPTYLYGYLADYNSGIVYYDNMECIKYLTKKKHIGNLPTQIFVTNWDQQHLV